MAKTATARSTQADETDFEEVMRRFKEEQAAKGTFKPKTPAVYQLRILPPKEKGLFYRKFGMHYGLRFVSTKFGDTKGVACPRLSLGQACSLHELWSKWKFEAYLPGNKVNKERKEMAYEIRPSERYVMNIINLNDLASGVQIWDVPKPTYELIMGVFAEEGDITHPETGRSIKATLSQQGDFTIWSAVIASKPGEIPIPNWRERRHDLDAYVSARLWDSERLDEIVGPLLSGEEAPRSRAPEPEPEPEEASETETAEDTDTDTDTEATPGTVDVDKIDDPELQKLLAKYKKNHRK